jgi:hypothetical protein
MASRGRYRRRRAEVQSYLSYESDGREEKPKLAKRPSPLVSLILVRMFRPSTRIT